MSWRSYRIPLVILDPMSLVSHEYLVLNLWKFPLISTVADECHRMSCFPSAF
jgi:hypothetical protein